ncbi:hypothetical protein FHX37_0306 [Haloactinospora alba]|uniref:Secreted protein n=1 Tax=Haloactinospora alba TaxID=405555 RepID=A0A543NF09_9ACTN|nr:DUF5719 family protein [Haloactinospora alba]TQN30428.1 hypothetical protein FHX37_0306 [Haloactinospora alba]
MRTLVDNRFALFGAVVLALAALFGIATVTHPLSAAGREEDPVAAPVDSALRVCPPRHEDGDSGEIAAAAVPTDRDGGSLSVAGNNPDAEPAATLDTPGEVWRGEAGDPERHTVVSAEGAMAAGMEATHTTLGEDEQATEVSCAEPGISTWFTAPGGEQLEELRLFLANVDGSAATANVDLYTTDGPAFSTDTRGVPVDAHGSAEVDLTGLLETTDAVAVHVRTQTGRVAPSLLARRSTSGTDWVPPANAPSERQVVPAVPSGEGKRHLLVATPEDTPATVRVRAYTPDGEADQDASRELNVPPAASATLSLGGPLQEEPATVTVEADQPIVAGLAMSRAGGDDTAYTAAADPLGDSLDNAALLPAGPDGTDSSLLFGAVSGPATVRLTPLLEDGTEGEARTVDIADGHTEAVTTDDPEGAQATLVATTGDSGPVHTGRVLTQGSGDDRATAARPVEPHPTRVSLPAAQDTLVSVVP